MSVSSTRFDPSAEAYKIQSGKNEGKSPALLYFRSRGQFTALANYGQAKSQGDPNRFTTYNRWVCERGEILVPTRMCPICRTRPVRVMGIVDSSGGLSVGNGFTACNDPSCKHELEARSPYKTPQIRPINWRILSDYHGADRENIQRVLDWAFEMPGRLNPNRAHQILRLGLVPDNFKAK